MIGALAIFAWPVLVAQLVIFGTAAFELIFAPAPFIEEGGLITLWRILAILNLAISPLMFIEISAGMAQTTWTQTLPLIPEILRETLAGRLWMWRFVAIVTLAIVLWMPRRELRAIGALTLSAILIGLGSLTSHAIDRGMLVVSVYAIHQAAGGLWLGALVSLLLSAQRGPEVLATYTPRVSTVCGWAVAAIAVSGIVIAFQWFGWDLDLLFDSAYGRALLWKLAFAATVLLLGGYNRFWQVPGIAHRQIRAILVRTVTGECALLLVVLACSAILANTPPPH